MHNAILLNLKKYFYSQNIMQNFAMCKKMQKTNIYEDDSLLLELIYRAVLMVELTR